MPDLETLGNWAQIGALFVAILCSVWAVWSYCRTRQRRALRCEFDPIVFPIEVRAGEALEGDITILVDGEPVENLFLVRVTLKNTGTLAIRKEHVVEDIVFSLGWDAGFLRQPRTIDKAPDNLQIDWRNEADAVVLGFTLLNPGDEVTVEFLCTGRTQLPEVAARIEGVNRLQVVDPDEVKLERQAAGTWLRLIGTVLLVTFAAVVRTVTGGPDRPLALVGMLYALAAVLAVTAFEPALGRWRLIRYRRHRSEQLQMAKREESPRTFHRYHFKIGNSIVHSGITEDLEGRERELKGHLPSGRITGVGPAVTEETAREWEKDQSKA